MTTSKDTPAFLRYFSSRFKPFTKPIFLGSLGGLLIAGLAIYQYWRHPEWLQTDSDNLTNTPIVEQQKSAQTSVEDLAAAANLDNVDFLLKEIEQNKTLSAIAAENQDKQKLPDLKREESEFSRFQKEQKVKLSKAGQSKSSNSSNPYSVGLGEGNKKIMELLKPPSFSSYQSNRTSTETTANKTNKFETDIIPNPVGNTYLSNRNKLQPQTSATPMAPPADAGNTGAVSNNAATNPNVPANNSAVNGNPTGAIISAPNGQNSQVTSNQPVNSNLGNSSVAASSLIQSQRTLPTPISNSAVSPSSTGSNIANPYLGTGSNSNNSYGLNNQGINPVGGVTSNPVNSVNGVNGNSVNGSNGFVGANSQSFQRPNIPGLTTTSNSITREGVTETAAGNDPNILQNNYRNSRLVTPNYNRSVPNGYQLQPQGYSTEGLGQNSNLSGASNPNRVGVSVGVPNNGGNLNSGQSTTTNAPLTRPSGTPSLQPSGVLSTSEIGQ